MVSGLFGASLGAIVTFFLNRKTARLDRQLKNTELDKASSYRFGDAVARLQSDSLGVRMGAIYELKKLGKDSSEDQEIIVRILGPYIRTRIEGEERLTNLLARPNVDVFLACEIVSHFFVENSENKINLATIKASDLSLYDIELHGANLFNARFQGASLSKAELQKANLSMSILEKAHLTDANLSQADLTFAHLQEAMLYDANLQEADLLGANLQKAKLSGTDLRGAKNLTAAQLLEAIVDDTTQLDPELRAEYDRLKAEQ